MPPSKAVNLIAIIKIIRPKHWIKNLFVLAPLLFAGKFAQPGEVISALAAFIAFCFAASAVYVFNDIMDIEADSHHPRKKHRPLPAGDISIGLAWRIAFALILLCAAASTYLAMVSGPGFVYCVALYLAINIYYCISGKHRIIVDAFCIALGFVLRVVAGAYAIGVEPTGWIIVTTFFLALFLGFGKRRGEMNSEPAAQHLHRSVLAGYPPGLLEQIIVSTGTIAIISYALYTLDASVVEKFGSPRLYYTVIPVAYGVFRYMYLLLRSEEGDPTEVLMRDAGLLTCVVVWLLAAVGIVYLDGGHFR